MKISDAGLSLIKQFEGFRANAYLCSAGVPTIGYGHTRGVKLGDVCTPEEAEAWLREDVEAAERCVNQTVAVPLTQHEFDALVSFVFNLGCGNFRKSTLLKLLNEGRHDEAAMEFRRWDRAGGVVLAGLTKRRLAEQRLFEMA